MVVYIEIGLAAIAVLLLLLAMILIYLEYKDEDRNQNVLVGVLGLIGLSIFLMVAVSVVLLIQSSHVQAQAVEVKSQEFDTLRSKNLILSNKLKRAIVLEDINIMYQQHFNNTALTQVNYMDLLNTSFSLAAEYQLKQDDWEYTVLLLEKRLEVVPKKIINTKVPNDDDFEYTADLIRIQKVLKFLGHYTGIEDGDQESTFTALKKYQVFANNEFNNRYPQKDTLWTNPGNYGFFGRGTLAKLKVHCRQKARLKK